MSPDSTPLESRKLGFLCALFIVCFFFFFTYTGLLAYFTFDDGTTIFACLHPFEVSVWKDLLHILVVFTKAFRPLTTMFWRPLYAAFGFNPLPYRIVVHIFLLVNIWIAYVLARRLEMSREAAALTALTYSYNASMNTLFYDTCLIGDITCFTFYGLALMVYVRGRQGGEPLTWHRIAGFSVLWGLALDSKELGVTLPGILVIYEVLYRYRDFRDKKKAIRVGGLLAALFVVGSIYLKVKVADMSQNQFYKPHVSLPFMLKNFGFYFQQLLYFPADSITPAKAFLILAAFIGAAALLRSRQALFGILCYAAGLIPVLVIESRAGYAVYLPYFGLTVAIGAIVAGIGTQIVRLTGRKELDRRASVAVFVCYAFLLTWAHMVKHAPQNGYFEWDKPKLVALMDYFRTTIPEFPPNSRILVKEDIWGPDYGLMFLLRYMYHDNTIWADRPNTMDRKPDEASYDLVVSYKAPDIDLSPPKLFGHVMAWEIRGFPLNSGSFVVTSPAAHETTTHIDFAPAAVRSRQSTVVTVPGLSNVAINAIYRVVSGTKSTTYTVANFCTLDAKSNCTITAPAAVGNLGAMVVDWIQPAGQRWIFTGGVLTLVE